ncbi:MAG: glycosyltransferase family 9 protein [Gammaproteobacteria bacterium]
MTDDEERLLVVTLSNIGDVVMTTPVLEALAAAFPGQAIDVVGDQRSSDVLRGAPWLGEVFHRDKRGGITAQFELLRRLRRRRYAVAVDLRTPLIPYLLRARRRYARHGRRGHGRHAVEEHFAVVASLLGAKPVPACRLHVDPTAAGAAGKALAMLPATARWLALAPGANWPGKCWPAAAYRALAERVGERFDGFVVLGSAADREAAAMLKALSRPCVDLTGQTDLATAAAILARAAAFVGNDSGLGHMAAALAVPTVTVFGPGEPERYRPWGRRTALALAPARDLARLPAATVAAVLLELLDGD